LPHLPFQDLFIEEDDGVERLILCGRRDLALHRQMRQKSLDLLTPHVIRMSRVVEENKPPHPLDVGLFSTKVRCKPTPHGLMWGKRATANCVSDSLHFEDSLRLDAGIFNAVMPEPDSIPQSVEQFRFWGRLSTCRS
jgi:hypothetical protein